MSQGDDFDFRPRLGVPRSLGRANTGSMRRFLNGARKRAGRVSSGGPKRVAFAGARRVIIQAKIVRISGGGGGGGLQRAHLSYLQRDGAGQDQERAELYIENTEGIDGHEWLEDHLEDRHHFRFMVSPEDGHQLGDLKPFVRDLVAQMEIDLETKLEWLAVDHHNTEHPHTHIVMSGKRDDGRDLVIPRDYLSHEMRERGSAILTRELGLQTEQELAAKLEQETAHQRVTRMDRILIRQMEQNGGVDLAQVQRNREHYKARLEKLRRMGLAQHEHGTLWSVDKALAQKLQALEKRKVISQRIERAVRDAGLDRIGTHDSGQYSDHERVSGRLLEVGLADELHGKAYAIVDGLDGRVHHFDLGTSYTKGLQARDMIEVKPRAPSAITMDQTIADVAEANEGLYSAAGHKRIDPMISERQLQMTQRRLSSLTKAGLAEALNDNMAVVPNGFLQEVETHFQKVTKRSPMIVRKLDGMGFEDQISTRGETWLDRQLAGAASEPLSHAGLGGEVHAAMAKRMQVHFERGLVADRQTKALKPPQLSSLQKEGLEHAAKEVAKQTGLTYRALTPGKSLEGSFKQTYATAHAKFAIVQSGRQFSLVPWREGLDRMRGKQLQISMARSSAITWTLGRSRGLSR